MTPIHRITDRQPDNPTPETPTPETDAALIEKLSCTDGGDEECTVYPAEEIVPADFARSLERRLAVSEQARREAETQLGAWQRSFGSSQLSHAIAHQEAAVTTLRTTCDTLRAEVERLRKPWHVALHFPTPNEPFDRFECKAVDTGEADRIITVECPELHAEVAALRAQLAAADGLVGALENAKSFIEETAPPTDRRIMTNDIDAALLSYQSARKGGGA